MGVTLYKSTDASAPSLTGQTGSLVALLDAILVNGYGTQAAAGWTIAYTGTNKRSYRQGSGSNSYYLDVDDSGPGGGGAREARMHGYETMSALATGTLPFPTAAQSSFGVVCRKSATADATARPWYCVADSTCFYLWVDTGDYTGPNYSFGFSFGDFFSYKSSDTYGTLIMGRSAENTSDKQYESVASLVAANAGTGTLVTTTTIAGCYVDRHWSGVGGALPFGKFSSILAQPGAGNAPPGTLQGAGCGYPNGPDGALELAPIWLAHQGSVRGYLKGLWAPCQTQPCGHGDTFSGTGNMAGKSFLALNAIGSNNGSPAYFQGQIIVETSNTWS